jgi:hypothetical protein
MTPLVEANHIVHGRNSPALCECRYSTPAHEFLTRTILSDGEDSFSRVALLFQIGASRRFQRASRDRKFTHCSRAGCSTYHSTTFRSSASSSIDIEVSSSFVQCRAGEVSCMEPYRRARIRRAKPSDMNGVRPTYLSVTFSQTSPSAFFGRKTRRRFSPLPLDAVCARPNVFSVVIANGPARQSPQSLQRSLSVIPCGA